jgi:hypothetical protein
MICDRSGLAGRNPGRGRRAADPEGNASRRPDRRGPVQQGDRDRSQDRPIDGQESRPQHPGQAQRPPSRRDCLAAMRDRVPIGSVGIAMVA